MSKGSDYEINEKREVLFKELSFKAGYWHNDVTGFINEWAGEFGVPEDKNYDRMAKEQRAYFMEYSTRRKEHEREELGIDADNEKTKYAELYASSRNLINRYYDRNKIDYNTNPYSDKSRTEREALSNKARNIIAKTEEDIYFNETEAVFRNYQVNNLSEMVHCMEEGGYGQELKEAVNVFLQNGEEPTTEVRDMLVKVEDKIALNLVQKHEALYEEMKNISSSEELVSKWERIRKTVPAMKYIADNKSINMYDDGAASALDRMNLSEEEKEKFQNHAEEMMDLYHLYEKRMALIGSEYGKVLPIDEMENMPESARNELINSVVKDEEAAQKLNETFKDIESDKWDMFYHRIENSLGRYNVVFCDENGTSLNRNDMYKECIEKGKPIFAMKTNVENPELIAVAPKGNTGDVIIGQDNIVKEPEKKVNLPEKPGFFAGILDAICRGLRLTSLRPKSCVDYQKALEENYEVLENNRKQKNVREKIAGLDLKNEKIEKFMKENTMTTEPIKPVKEEPKAVEEKEKVNDNLLDRIGSLESDLKKLRDQIKEAELNDVDSSVKVDLAAKAVVMTNLMSCIAHEKDKSLDNSQDNMNLQNLCETYKSNDELIKASVEAVKKQPEFSNNAKNLTNDEMSNLCEKNGLANKLKTVNKLSSKKPGPAPVKDEPKKTLSKTEDQPVLATEENKKKGPQPGMNH